MGRMQGEKRLGEKTARGVTIIAGLTLVAVLGAIIILCASDTSANKFAVGVTAFLVFLAAGAVGAGLGFLFGLPRATVADQAMARGAAPARGDAMPGTPPAQWRASKSYVANSNLIKVSDWLTTIIIGLGLVNLGSVVPGLEQLASSLKEPLGGQAYSGAFGLALAVGGTLIAFLLFYLWTTVRVRELLEDSEREFETVPDMGGRTVPVPNVTHVEVKQARRILQYHGVDYETDPPNAAENDIVKSQTPTAGERMPTTDVVTLHTT